MKSYTDIEQSKKLAEILPIESADMWYCPYPNEVDWYDEPRIGKADLLLNQLPCWSLAALIEIIRKPTAFDLLIDGRGYRCHCRDKHKGKFYGTDNYCDTPIDACIEVILKLHEQKLL